MVAKMNDVEDRRIHIEVDSNTYIFECTPEELINFKMLLLWTLQTLLGQRRLLYEALAKVNGELDRRVNEKAAKG